LEKFSGRSSYAHVASYLILRELVEHDLKSEEFLSWFCEKKNTINCILQLNKKKKRLRKWKMISLY